MYLKLDFIDFLKAIVDIQRNCLCIKLKLAVIIIHRIKRLRANHAIRKSFHISIIISPLFTAKCAVYLKREWKRTKRWELSEHVWCQFSELGTLKWENFFKSLINNYVQKINKHKMSNIQTYIHRKRWTAKKKKKKVIVFNEVLILNYHPSISWREQVSYF